MSSSALFGFLKKSFNWAALEEMCRPPAPGRPATRLELEALEERRLPDATALDPAVLAADVSILAAVTSTVAMPKGDPRIAFLGDSVTWGFANTLGAQVWASTMAPRGAADYGIFGQNAGTLLWQIEIGQLAGIHPSVVVLMIGTNDLTLGESPEQTALETLIDAYAIHFVQPRAQVLVLGITPRGQSPDDPFRLEVQATNALVGQLVSLVPSATFADIGPALEEPDGSISDAVLSDYIHPTALGYARLAAALEGPLDQALAAGG